MPFDTEREALKSNKLIKKLAERDGITPAEAVVENPQAKRIKELMDALSEMLMNEAPTVAVEDEPAPSYLREAAEKIAARDGISLERAYARVGREHPELAKRYRAETN